MAAYEIVERDEARVVTGRYVGDGGGRRVDVVVSSMLVREQRGEVGVVSD
jgi:hypothetical protein